MIVYRSETFLDDWEEAFRMEVGVIEAQYD